MEFKDLFNLESALIYGPALILAFITLIRTSMQGANTGGFAVFLGMSGLIYVFLLGIIYTFLSGMAGKLMEGFDFLRASLLLYLCIYGVCFYGGMVIYATRKKADSTLEKDN